MRERWEVFEGRQFKAAAEDDIRVTLAPKGTFYLNLKAFRGLGSPTAVELMYDGTRRVVGMRPTDPRKRNAFQVKSHLASGQRRRISCASFCHHYNLRTKQTLLFDRAEIRPDGILELPFESAVVVRRGAR